MWILKNHLTYNIIDVIITLASKFVWRHEIARDIFRRYISFFIFKYKRKSRVAVPATKIILCFSLGFHHCHYLIVIIRLIARLIHMKTLRCTSFLKDFLWKECFHYNRKSTKIQQTLTYFTKFIYFQSSNYIKYLHLVYPF